MNESEKAARGKASATARIAAIERGSLRDGPGLRTVVFFKGCPLSCRWCHNPECISFEKQALFYPEKCIGCGHCADGCYAGARTTCGTDMTAEEIVRAILSDRPYYGEKGGVTFSGGEPLAQRAVLSECIDLCRENGVSCAVETSLCYYDEAIFSKLSLVMADLKIWDGKLHRQYVGIDNGIILENFKKLSTLPIPVIARTPIIPEISQNVPAISAFLKSLPNVIRYELLPYHPLGRDKARALGKEAECFSVPDKQYMEELSQYAFVR